MTSLFDLQTSCLFMITLLFNMLSNTADDHPAAGEETVSEVDEPPDDRRLAASKPAAGDSDQTIYTKAKQAIPDAKKESLLTRALLSSPDLSPVEQSHMVPLSGRLNGAGTSHDRGHHSALSTAELTSDGGTTTRSHTPSPPHPNQVARLPPTGAPHEQKQPQPKVPGQPLESELEANLGRKRCIKFACGRKSSLGDESKAMSDPMKDTKTEQPQTNKRRPALTFVCPAPPRTPGSDDNKAAEQQPAGRRPSTPAGGSATSAARGIPKATTDITPSSHPNLPSQKSSKSANVAVGGLGDFQPSEVTRFHEFGSSMEEEEDWVSEATQHKPKITLSDCMRKENAIRKLGEEVEAEVKQDEDEDGGDAEEEHDNDDDDDDDDDGVFENEDDDADEVETLHYDLSDDGNESDNEAGFASDDDSDDGSVSSFWTPAMATAATSVDQTISVQQSPRRRPSNSSLELEDQDATLAKRKQSAVPSTNVEKSRSGTPNLPDSTDFVCGTLDEDRPLEAAYKSCMEKRRRSKFVTLPQDIDPSFPTSDLDDDEDDDDDDDDDNDNAAADASKSRVQETLDTFEFRGRQKGGSTRTSPNQSPGNRQPTPPPPRKVHGRSPRRLRSPPPTTARHKSPPPPQQHRRPSGQIAHAVRPTGINISGLAQRHARIRTGSLPRTPNPFFARQDQSRRPSRVPANKAAADGIHTRGAVDIVAGLEKKRQKRKEKFWRQHCRKVAKEQQERKPLSGRGAERMKELGLEVAERFRAYGFGQEAQLVLSI